MAKTMQFSVRVTPGEKARIAAEAQRLGMTMTELVARRVAWRSPEQLLAELLVDKVPAGLVALIWDESRTLMERTFAGDSKWLTPTAEADAVIAWAGRLDQLVAALRQGGPSSPLKDYALALLNQIPQPVKDAVRGDLAALGM